MISYLYHVKKQELNVRKILHFLRLCTGKEICVNQISVWTHLSEVLNAIWLNYLTKKIHIYLQWLVSKIELIICQEYSTDFIWFYVNAITILLWSLGILYPYMYNWQYNTIVHFIATMQYALYYKVGYSSESTQQELSNE